MSDKFSFDFSDFLVIADMIMIMITEEHPDEFLCMFMDLLRIICIQKFAAEILVELDEIILLLLAVSYRNTDGTNPLFGHRIHIGHTNDMIDPGCMIFLNHNNLRDRIQIAPISIYDLLKSKRPIRIPIDNFFDVIHDRSLLEYIKAYDIRIMILSFHTHIFPFEYLRVIILRDV
jgi:hypothetical protein